MYLYLGQAIDLQTRGHKAQAAKEFQRAIEDGLDHPAAHYNLGLLKKELKDYEGARKDLTAAAGHPELALGANLALGRLAKMKGDMTEAARYLIQALRQADALSVDGGETTQLGQLYDTIPTSQTEGTKPSAGLSRTRSASSSGPGWLSRLKKAASSWRPNARLGGADRRNAGRPGTASDPGSEPHRRPRRGRPSHLRWKRRCWPCNMPHLPPPPEDRGDSLQHRPSRAGLQKLTSVAETYRIRGESSQAAQIYSKIISYAPINIPARARLIELLSQQDKADDALRQFLELADLYRQMAEIDMSRKTLADALRLAQRSTIDRSWSLKILHQMGDIDLSRLDWRRALRVYEQIRSIDAGDDKARHLVIDLNLRLGQEDQAAKELDNYLEHLVQAGRSNDALAKLEELAREYPGKQALHARLAEAYRAAGRTADAIAQYDALGEIQLDAGRVQDAIRTIQTIVDLDPPDAEGYRELLQNLKAGA
jgi:tetratricopeptide (TPR) repeat protein